MKTASFTGHRKPSGDPKAGKAVIASEVRSMVDDGFDTFITGMAMGGDIVFAETVLALIEEGRCITLIAAVPFVGQTATWRNAEWKARWETILRKCHRIYVVQAGQDYEAEELIEAEKEAKALEYGVATPAMMARNRWMVDNSTKVLSLWDGFPGKSGTSACVAYAKSQRRPIRWIQLPKFAVVDILPAPTLETTSAHA